MSSIIKHLIDAVVVLLSVLVFTSPITAMHQTEPFFLSMPRTLWAGILISSIITILTIVRSLLKD